jgi:hypothetical protein
METSDMETQPLENACEKVKIESSTANESSNWDKSYRVLQLLAYLLIPSVAFTAWWSVSASKHTITEMGPIELPDSMQFFVSFGIVGYGLLASVSIIIIALMGIRRNRLFATVITFMLIVSNVLFYLIAIWASWLPFLRIIYRLTGSKG